MAVDERGEGGADPSRGSGLRGLADPVHALDGAFQGRADRPVNFVNAPSIAAERGVEVREERSRTARDLPHRKSRASRASSS